MSFDKRVEIIKFGNVEKAIDEGNELAILELVTKVSALSTALAPIDQGQLRNSIMGRTKDTDVGFNDGPKDPAPRKIAEMAKDGEGYVGSAVLHAIYNEFGTRKMPAQPFLRPAINSVANGNNVKREVSKFQNQAVAKGMRKGPRKKRVVG